ncbi:MAG TPA: LysR family transcriptional regulator [Thermoleophilaceae bacterium]|nr:LysR family transcriptional regulator [Thermoleophilaceae bacterium]
MSIELKHLRAFVAVAEELNFTRAADRLHLAQQALSSQIRQLEERMGVQLLIRTTRKVELTPAGVTLLEHARTLLAGTDRALAAVREVGADAPVLTVGLVVPADHEPMQAALAHFAERRPEVETRFCFGEVLDPSGGLRNGSADVAVVVGQFDRTGLEYVTLWSDPRGVAVSAHHELAAKESVTIEELIAQPTFDFPAPDRAFRSYWMAIDHRGGRPPHIVAQFRSLDGLLEAIRSGLGVNLIRKRIVDSLGPSSGVVFRPVAGLEPAEVALAWNAGDRREIVTGFVAAACECFGREPVPALTGP